MSLEDASIKAAATPPTVALSVSDEAVGFTGRVRRV